MEIMSCVKDREVVYNIVESIFIFIFYFLFPNYSSFHSFPLYPRDAEQDGQPAKTDERTCISSGSKFFDHRTWTTHAYLPAYHLPTYSIYRTVQQSTVPTSSRQGGRQAGEQYTQDILSRKRKYLLQYPRKARESK